MKTNTSARRIDGEVHKRDDSAWTRAIERLGICVGKERRCVCWMDEFARSVQLGIPHGHLQIGVF